MIVKMLLERVPLSPRRRHFLGSSHSVGQNPQSTNRTTDRRRQLPNRPKSRQRRTRSWKSQARQPANLRVGWRELEPMPDHWASARSAAAAAVPSKSIRRAVRALGKWAAAARRQADHRGLCVTSARTNHLRQEFWRSLNSCRNSLVLWVPTDPVPWPASTVRRGERRRIASALKNLRLEWRQQVRAFEFQHP